MFDYRAPSALHREDSVLLIIDIQERLRPAIAAADHIVEQAEKLTQISQLLGVPIVVTEQYPQGLGATVASLQKHLQQAAVIEKIHFSAMREEHLPLTLESLKRKQIVVCGTETHVCVLQTVLDLLQAGYDVYVVTDIVGSRDPANKELALQRMAAEGAALVSYEMVVFEWLERAGTDTFRHVSKNFVV